MSDCTERHRPAAGEGPAPEGPAPEDLAPEGLAPEDREAQP
jgi:hypothetical protein